LIITERAIGTFSRDTAAKLREFENRCTTNSTLQGIRGQATIKSPCKAKGAVAMAYFSHKRSVLTVQRGDMKMTHKLSNTFVEVRFIEPLKQLLQWFIGKITTFF
jgi:hypothetical protein